MKAGWQPRAIGDVSPIANRKVTEFAGERPYFATGAVGPEGDLVSVADRVTFAVRPSRAGCMPEVGDIGFARMKGTRKVISIDGTLKGALFSTGFCFLAPRPDVEPRYLFHFVTSEAFQNAKDEAAGDGIMGGIKNGDAGRIRIPLPPIPEQKRIAGILDEAFAAIATAKANAEKNIENARALFESHLNAVFTQRGDGWVETTIGAHIRFIDYRGKTPEKTASGLRLITAKNVKMGCLQQEPMEFVAPESYDAWMTRGLPRLGDVLFTTEAPLANVAQLDTDEKVVFAQRIIIMQPDASKLEPTFLKYLLLSQPVQQRIHAKGTGATVKGIKASLLRTVEISFPKSLAEQGRVVAILAALSLETQRLAAIYQQKLAALEELKKALLHQAFSGEL